MSLEHQMGKGKKICKKGHFYSQSDRCVSERQGLQQSWTQARLGLLCAAHPNPGLLPTILELVSSEREGLASVLDSSSMSLGPSDTDPRGKGICSSGLLLAAMSHQPAVSVAACLGLIPSFASPALCREGQSQEEWLKNQ